MRRRDAIPRFAKRARGLREAAREGVLSKETHDTVVRLAPPLVIARATFSTRRSTVSRRCCAMAKRPAAARPDTEGDHPVINLRQRPPAS